MDEAPRPRLHVEYRAVTEAGTERYKGRDRGLAEETARRIRGTLQTRMVGDWHDLTVPSPEPADQSR
jgi:hypothetical protein